MWRDADRTPLGADGWTLHLVREEARVSQSQQAWGGRRGGRMQWRYSGQLGVLVVAAGLAMFTVWSWESTT